MLKPFLKTDRLEAGCDEAGRGCLAGPVFAAAVILPPSFYHPLLNDSKKMSVTDRETVRVFIKTNALAWSVGIVDHKKIDRINILQASLLAMHRALNKLKLQPDFILVDGNKFLPFKNIPHQCVIKGDGIFSSIAAASVLAKTYRDDYMKNLHLKYPQYCWNKNMGYPTKEHRGAISKFGITPLHRKSFRLLAESETLLTIF